MDCHIPLNSKKDHIGAIPQITLNAIL